MKLLKIINPANLLESETDNFTFRKAARAIIFDKDKKIALLWSSRLNYHKLPGGGIEKQETVLDGLKRECLEEVGCRIEILDKVGIILEYRDEDNLKQESYCYLAKIINQKGEPKFTEEEINDFFQLKWVSLLEALNLLEKDSPKYYEGSFVKTRDLFFLKEAKKIIDQTNA